MFTIITASRYSERRGGAPARIRNMELPHWGPYGDLTIISPTMMSNNDLNFKNNLECHPCVEMPFCCLIQGVCFWNDSWWNYTQIPIWHVELFVQTGYGTYTCARTSCESTKHSSTSQMVAPASQTAKRRLVQEVMPVIGCCLWSYLLPLLVLA